MLMFEFAAYCTDSSILERGQGFIVKTPLVLICVVVALSYIAWTEEFTVPPGAPGPTLSPLCVENRSHVVDQQSILLMTHL